MRQSEGTMLNPFERPRRSGESRNPEYKVQLSNYLETSILKGPSFDMLTTNGWKVPSPFVAGLSNHFLKYILGIRRVLGTPFR